jgi:hypothetical protein
MEQMANPTEKSDDVKLILRKYITSRLTYKSDNSNLPTVFEGDTILSNLAICR